MVLTRAQTRSAQPNSLPIVNRPSSKIGQTFRVRGVPRGWNRDELHAFLVGKVSASTTVCSLANEVHERSQTATVSFQDNLSQLEELLTGPIWNIPLPSSSNQSTGTSSLKLDDDFLGITTLYAPPSQDHKIDIIAISGLGGHAFGSFKERHGEHMWLRDALPYHITGDDNKKPNSRIMIYGYNSNLQHSNSFQNLEDLGTAFHSNLRNLANTGAFRPIVFVAHSLGGLIVKQTLISLSRSDDEQDQKLLRAVYGIAFFGVPHHGMNIQSLISIVGNGPNRFLLESIGPHSSQILSIYQREFPRALGGQGECKIICFYETRLSPTAKQDRRGKWNMTGPDAVLVSKSSATHCRPWENGPEHICAIDRNHSEMVKFGSEDSEYEKVIGRIQSLVREAQEKCLTQKHPLQPNLSHQAQECLKSLAFGEMDNRAMEIEPAISGTCEWLLQHETYKNWAASNSGLLWVKGKPGSGKSTLLKYAFSSQKDLPNARDSDLVLSFFFHGRGSELQKTPFGFFRSLLHQTLGQAPNLLSDLVDTFEKKCKEIGEYYEKWQWHPEQLWSFLESSLPRILATRSIWLFVDALDECGESNAKGLVRKLKLLLEKTTSSSIYSNALRICFSCRHYPILSSPGLAEVCLEWENRADILTYVQSELSSLEGIQDLIIDRASGVFLWAQLVVKRVQDLELDGAGPNEIQAAVNSIPKNLESLYNELIRNMRPASLKLIQWIHFSTRPLSIKELRWAMSIDANCSSIHACQNAMGYIPDDERMRKRIVRLSQGLAEIAPGSRTQIVQFIHQSVKDFFIDKGLLALNSRFMSTNEAIGLSHLYLSETCIRYLAMEEVGQLTSYQRDQMSADFPFLQYATTSCVTHMKQSDDHNTPAKQFLELFAWPSNDLVSLWTKVYREIDEHSVDCPSENTSLVHIAASYGIQGVMNAILQSLGQITVGVDSKDKYGRTPLSLAAEEGHEAIVKLLLATGQVEVDSKDEDGWTPLLWASIYGHEGIVKLLLATGQVEVDLKDKYSRTPLSLAAEEGHEAIVKLLLATGQVKINSKDKYGRTPLSWAVGGGHEGIVKLLLATGQVKVDLKDEDGWTPLLWASIYGHEGIVKLLLATGQVEVDLKDKYSRTPLSLAAEEGHEAIVKLLLATGQVKINSKDKYGRTPLSWASIYGHEGIVKLLLATGQVEIDSKDEYGRTPLSVAAKRGHEAVVKLLLATGQVEIDSKDNYGQTPLSLAMERGHENIVNLLKQYALSHLISPPHRRN